jgi:hypothetical protein
MTEAPWHFDKPSFPPNIDIFSTIRTVTKYDYSSHENKTLAFVSRHQCFFFWDTVATSCLDTLQQKKERRKHTPAATNNTSCSLIILPLTITTTHCLSEHAFVDRPSSNFQDIYTGHYHLRLTIQMNYSSSSC